MALCQISIEATQYTTERFKSSTNYHFRRKIQHFFWRRQEQKYRSEFTKTRQVKEIVFFRHLPPHRPPLIPSPRLQPSLLYPTSVPQNFSEIYTPLLDSNHKTRRMHSPWLNGIRSIISYSPRTPNSRLTTTCNKSRQTSNAQAFRYFGRLYRH